MNDYRKRKEPQPRWYESLKKQPHTSHTFKQEMMDNVIERVGSGSSSSRSLVTKKSWRFSAISIAAACAMLLILLLPKLLNTTPDHISAAYNPQEIKVGDKAAGMTAVEIIRGSYGVGSIQTVFEGNVEISGRFEYRTIADPYHANEVIFRVDEESHSKLPLIANLEDSTERTLSLVLKTSDPALQNKFGTPGATGHATVRISRYSSVYAEILEGTPNSGNLKEVLNADVQPARNSDLSDSELAAQLKPFPANPELNQAKPELIFEWLKNVEQHYIVTLGALALIKIDDFQKQILMDWLSAAFTEGEASILINQLLMKDNGAQYIMSSTLGILPTSEIREVRDAKLQQLKDSRMLYSSTLILTGTQDATLQCDLLAENGKLKISSFSHKLQ